MDRPRPIALAFDVYGTLIDVSAMGRVLGRPAREASALAWSWRRHQLEITWLLSLMERYEDFEAVSRHALDTALAEAEIDVPNEARGEALAALASLSAHPDAGPALDRLGEAGIRLAVLSNGTPAMLDALLAAAGIRNRFSEVVSVDEVGVYKPSPRVYLHAAERLGLAPNDMWLVSANPFDCAGAKAAGLGAVKVERGPSYSYPFALPPDLVVGTLGELAEALAPQ